MTDLERIIATIDARNGYDGLIAAFRARIVELGTHFEAVDEVAGLPTRYTGKLLNENGDVARRSGRKSLGRESFGPLLGALGVKVLIVVDDAADYKIKRGMNGLKRRGSRGTKIDNAGPDAGPPFDRFGQIGRAKQLMLNSPTYRSMSARIAACARWQKHRAKQAKLARRRELRRKLTTLARASKVGGGG